MQILVIGAGGLLGSNLVEAARSWNLTVAGTHHTKLPGLDVMLYELDIRDLEAFEQVINEVSPDSVINAAAMTDVDECERLPEIAMAVNAQAPAEMAAMCDQRGIQFTHISTDYIFDGMATTPYVESDSPAPIQEYGRTKLQGERGVTAEYESALIPRLSFVYGVHHGQESLSGFPAWVTDQLQAGEETSLFTDQHLTPTRAGCAAETILSLIKTSTTGIYHVASKSCVTPFEFGDMIRERLGAPAELVVRSDRSAVDRDAPRPAYTCLDVEKVTERIGIKMPTIAEDLNAIDEWLGGTDGP